jgi:hypothetical protein
MIFWRRSMRLVQKAVTSVTAFVVLGLTFCVLPQRSALAQGRPVDSTRAESPAVAQTGADPAAAEAAASVGFGAPAERSKIIAVLQRSQTLPFKLSSEAIGPNGLWLVVKHSPILTALLRQDMRRRGYKLATSARDASSLLGINVLMTLEAKGRQLNINLPAIVEKNSKDDPDLQTALAEGNTNKNFVLPLDGWGSKIVNNVGGPSMGMSIFAIGNFFEATGLAAKFNEWMVGDARGVCLAKMLGQTCPLFDATIHHLQLNVFFQTQGNAGQTGGVHAAVYIPKTDLASAFLMAWSDFNRAATGQDIPPCHEKHPENCTPEL